jgi:YD repeat-containing protein
VDLDTHYTYDAVGNTLSIADTPAGGARDIQCFAYDGARRLTEAWSTASALSDPCAGGDVATSGVGGPAPYHQSWTYYTSGDRRTETAYSTSAGADVRRTYTYPGVGQVRPHTLSKVEETTGATINTTSFQYDERGNTYSRDAGGAHTDFRWDPEWHLTSATASNQTTNYVYDADGNLLVRKEQNATTLYLAGMELRLDLATRQVSGTRFYSFADKNIAVRTAAGLSFKASDHHGTATAIVDAASGAITWRRTTPFGPSGERPGELVRPAGVHRRNDGSALSADPPGRPRIRSADRAVHQSGSRAGSDGAAKPQRLRVRQQQSTVLYGFHELVVGNILGSSGMGVGRGWDSSG